MFCQNRRKISFYLLHFPLQVHIKTIPNPSGYNLFQDKKNPSFPQTTSTDQLTLKLANELPRAFGFI